MTYTIHVIGEARPEAKRQRFFSNRAGKTIVGPRTDEPDRADWKSYVRAEALQVCPEPMAGPLYVDITVIKPRPASYPNRPTKGNPWPWHWWKKPDVDNLQKPIMDALTHVAWLDDAQITDCAVHKRFGDRWEVWVTICPQDALGWEPPQAVQRWWDGWLHRLLPGTQPELDLTPGDKEAA